MTDNQRYLAEMAEIKALLLRSDKAVQRALVVIYDRQTRDEKASDDTKHQNQMGFSCFHVKSGSYLACWVLSGRNLTGKHLERARKLVCHYTRQLVEVARAKRAATSPATMKTPIVLQIARDRGIPVTVINLPRVCGECDQIIPTSDGYCACREYGD